VWHFSEKCAIVNTIIGFYGDYCDFCKNSPVKDLITMIYDIQKAGILKRISAWLLDFIVLLIVITGCSAVLSYVLRYDSCSDRLLAYYDQYETQYNTSFDLTQEEYNTLSEEAAKNYDDAYAALIADEDAMYTYNMLINLTLIMISVGILLGYVIAEFLVPLILKNGQTLGKKIFGIAVMRTNGVQMPTVSLFIRTFLGKYTIETMIPVLMVVMLLFNTIGIVGTAVIFGILILQLILVIVTKTNSAIHDILADTVTVDLASQMIFRTEEELLEYKKKVAAEDAARQPY